MAQKNYPLVEQLHGQFVDQWTERMVKVIKENPIEVIHGIVQAMENARDTDEIKPIHVRKWLINIFTSEILEAAEKAVDVGRLLGYFDELESKSDWHDDDPIPLAELLPEQMVIEEDPDDEWGRMSGLRDCADQRYYDVDTDNIELYPEPISSEDEDNDIPF